MSFVIDGSSGTLRNVSSAGEPARVFMRSCAGLVDALLWTIQSSVKRNDDIDNKVRVSLCLSVSLFVCLYNMLVYLLLDNRKCSLYFTQSLISS